MQAVCGQKYDVSTVRCWVWQFKQEEVGEASLYDKARLGRPGWNLKTLAEVY
jgi:hypothetical protein